MGAQVMMVASRLKKSARHRPKLRIFFHSPYSELHLGRGLVTKTRVNDTLGILLIFSLTLLHHLYLLRLLRLSSSTIVADMKRRAEAFISR
jgi:hypothetical protein